MKLPRNRILIEITEEDRDKIFKKVITSTTGEEFTLFRQTEEKNRNTDRFYSQTVNMGRVLQVADDCKQVKVDDIVLFDNLVDSDEGIIVEQSVFRKKIVILESHTYHNNDYLIPPHGKQYRPQWVWRNGNVDEISRILGIYRDGKLICPKTMVITDHHNDEDDIRKYVGIIYDYKKIPVVRRVIRAVPEGSPFKVGDNVLVLAEAIMNYDFGPHNFDVFGEDDVLMTFDSEIQS
jgi:hypothetical protein